jgi:hypothetical protein
VLPSVGESYAFGPLGGGGSVAFDNVALNAIRYASPDASRQQIIEGIGRGIGRSAAHEFAHQILGATSIHSEDPNSYEHRSADSPAHYYGELHWATARPLLQEKIGSNPSSW